MTDFVSIDPEQSPRDHTSQSTEEALLPNFTAIPPPQHHLDISGALEAVQLTASTLSTMARRIEALEAHVQGLQASEQELAAQCELLITEVSDIIRQRDSLAATLSDENECGRRLETLIAQQVTRAMEFERSLGATHADFARIVDAVTKAFAPFAFEG